MAESKTTMKNNALKWVLALSASIFFVCYGNAQWAVQTTYVNSKIGTGGVNLLAVKTLKRHEVGFGLRMNLYSLAHKDNQNNIYTKRFYPTKFYQKFGLAAFYEYNLFPAITPAQISVFTDVQLAYGPTRNEFITINLNDTSGIPIYEFTQERFGPFLWIENTIGVSIQVPIYGRWWLVNKAGVGLMSILGDKFYGSENTAVLVGNWYDWELTYTFQVGLRYSFQN